LKQARQRVSRLLMKDGARSSLPQYRQTNFSAVDVARADCGGRREALLVFTGCAGFCLAATAFLVDTVVSAPARGSGGAATILPFVLRNTTAGLLLVVT
jgi:hypothetical protein